MTKYLVTGKNGQLAQKFIQTLKNQNKSFKAYSKQELDIANQDRLESIISEEKPNYIINCAAYNLVDSAEQDNKLAIQINQNGPKNLAIIAKQHNIKLIHYSTDYVFSGEKKDGPYTEQDQPSPINKYGYSKLLGEQAIQETNPNHLIFRVSWVHGTGTQNFPHKLINWAKDNKILKISCDEFASPTPTKFIVENTLKAIEKNLQGLYHLVPDTFLSRYEWAKQIAKDHNLTNLIIPTTRSSFNLPAKRPFFSALSNQKFFSALKN